LIHATHANLYSRGEAAMIRRPFLSSLGLCAALAMLPACNKAPDDTAADHAPATAPAGTLVTKDNFIRAETDRMFGDFLKLSGGVNRLAHIRKPTPLDQQTVVRMNRDTIYSASIIDSSQGGTVTLPPAPDGHYISVHFIDNDHYDLGAINTPGTHPIPKTDGHIAALFRIQVLDPNDAAEIARLNAWQDGLKIDAKASAPFAPGSWDKPSLDQVRAGQESSCRAFPNFEKGMMPRGMADPDQRLCAAAAGWGLLPATQATYFSYAGGHPITECRRATYQVPKNGAFWSIQVYDKTGFIASENSTLNSRRARLNPDGTFTAHFGSKELCGDVPNRLDVSDGWNFMMRVYKPDPATVLGGRYTLPATEAVPKG
jgi:hypothetical protein